MANLIYKNGKLGIANATIDWDAGGQTFRILLATSAYTPVVTHQFVNEVTNELSGGSYARQDMATRTTALNGNNVDFKADNSAYTSLTNGQTAAWAIIYKFVTNDADSILIGAIDLTPGIIMTGDVTIKWDAAASNGAVFRMS